MDHRLLRFLFAAALLLPATVGAQTLPFAFNQNSSWWRNGAALDLDFANSRYYLNGTTATDLSSFLSTAGGTFSRASSATYFDSAGVLRIAAADVPRLDYNPANRAPRGLLLEGASTNLFDQSQALSSLSMSGGTPSMTNNTTVAPDGTTTAETLTNAHATNPSYFHRAVTLTGTAVGDKVTYSIFLKTISGAFSINWAGASQVTGGTVTSVSVGGGWSRYQITGTAGVANPSARAQINVNPGTSVAAWGLQMELGPTASSYIPTDTSPVTRAADTLSLPTTGWLNAAAGTLLVNQDLALNRADTNPILGASQGDSFGVTYQGSVGTNICALVDGSASGCTGAVATAATYRFAASYSASSSLVSKNGATAVSATGKTLATATTLWLGRDFDGTSSVVKRMQRLTYFGRAMPAASVADFSR